MIEKYRKCIASQKIYAPRHLAREFHHAVYTNILIKRRSVGKGITTGRMEKRTGKEGDYYVVEFSWKESIPAQVQKLIEFAEVNALVNARFAQCQTIAERGSLFESDSEWLSCFRKGEKNYALF